MDENNNHVTPEGIPNDNVVPAQQAPAAPQQTYQQPQQQANQQPQRQAYVPQEPAFGGAEPKAKKSPLGVIAVIAALLIVAAVGFFLAGRGGSPVSMLGKGLSKTIKSLSENPTVALLADVSDGGSLEMSCDLDTVSDGMVDGSVMLKVYSEKEKAAVIADAEIEDIELDAEIFANKDEIVLSSDTLLDGNGYGISLKDLAKNFEDSIFGPDGDYSLGIENIEEYLDPLENSEQLSKDAQAIIDRYLEQVMKLVDEHAETSKENDVLEFADEEVKVTAVTVTIDTEALYHIVRDLLEYIQKDKDLETFLYDNAMPEIRHEDDYGYVSAGFSLTEDVIDEFYDGLDDLIDELDDVDLDDMSEMELELVGYISKSGSYLVGADFVLDDDYDKYKVSLRVGPSLKELRELSLSYDDGYSKVKASYIVETNDKEEYYAELKVKVDGETTIDGEVCWDKQDGDFWAEYTDDWGYLYGVEGTLETGSKSTVLVLETVYDDYDEFDLDVTVTLTPSDKMPSAPKYTDILSMDEDDFEDLAYDLEDVLGELLYYLY